MATPISQKEYLKRYLGGGGGDDKKKKKKKKKEKSSTGAPNKGMRIIEDTMDIKNVPYGYGEDDDDPTIAEVTYEDDSIKIMEEFKASKKWKKLEDDIPNQPKGIDRMVDFSIIKQEPDASPPTPQRNKKNPSSTKQQRHDSDSSAPRRQRHDSDGSPPRKVRHDSDSSPPRRKRHDCDASPPRRKRHDSDGSPPRRERHDSDPSPSKRQRHNSDASPPRRQRHDSDASPPRRQRHDSDASPPRRQRHDSDASPPRRQRHNSDASPPRRQRHDSDASPPRRQRHDSDASPPRRMRHDSDTSPPRRQRHDSDASPPRRQRHDSDASPPRRQKHDSDASVPKQKKLESDSANRNAENSSPASGKEEGSLRPERKMTTQEYLLARKRGKLKKDTPEEMLRKDRERRLQLEAEERNKQWKHGVKQVQQYQQKLAEDAHEMGKAFARSADDVDLNSRLKEVVREEDPMLEYLSKKQEKTSSQPRKPLYQGPFPPNRLNIRPGYRWDGVDRSNGFEKQWFERQSNKRAHDEDAYKWSVSDM